MALANVSNQLLKSQGNDTTVAANYPITGDGSTLLPLGLDEDYSGADGESLTFDIADITDGHRVTLSGSQGSSSFDVLNGQDGANGVNGVNGADGQSVTFDVTNITNGHRVTLSGEQGSSSFDVMNGDDGFDGVSPTFRFAENADGVTVIVSGAQGEESFTLYNSEGGHSYSAGQNIDITNDTISGRDWTTEINTKLDTTAFDLPNSAIWDNTYNTVNANSAQWSNDTTYTAGQNINITNNLISGKDWTADIESAISSVSGNYYPMTGNPSGFLTAVDLSNYYTKNETSSREEISDAFAACGGAAISGQYVIDDSTITADCSAFCMYEQANSPCSYQLMATANSGSWHGYGYTMSRPENLLMYNVSSIAQNYAVSAVSSRVRLINYPDITFSAVS